MPQPRISVFTPSHDPKFLNEAYQSLANQTEQVWEWNVVLNNDASPWQPPVDDDRVHVSHIGSVSGVGEAKSKAVELCQAPLIVELDHDDILTRKALQKVIAAFDEFPDAGLVHSHNSTIDAEGNPTFRPFATGNGWRYKKAIVDGVDHTFSVSMPTTPHNVSLIWYAPNHLRAFTRLAYDKAGGYDITLDVLDDQDLMARLYQVGEFVLIDECLYLQRGHEGATQIRKDVNPRIQTETVLMYDRTIELAALAWAERLGLTCLDLGGAHGQADPRYLAVDQYDVPGVDIAHTFPNKLDAPDSSVGVIRAVDFLEHVYNKVAMMNEIHRLLVPGGILLSSTPSTDGRGAFQDPTHVAFWNSNSFWYYTNPNYASYVPEIKAKFQMSRVINQYPSDWHKLHEIIYVKANLIVIKDHTPRNGGMNHWIEGGA